MTGAGVTAAAMTTTTMMTAARPCSVVRLFAAEDGASLRGLWRAGSVGW